MTKKFPRTQLGWGLWILSLLPCLLFSCGPDHPDVEANVPAETRTGPAKPREFTYQKEDPPPPPVDPYELALSSGREKFTTAYAKAGRPRMTFVANVLAGEVAATPNRPNDTPRLTSTADQPQSAEAVPVDRAVVENQFIDVFQRIDSTIRIVDLGVARGQFDRAKTTNKEIEVLRNNNLTDLAILLELRVDRNDGLVESVDIRDGNRDVHARGVSKSSRGNHIAIACTARAVRVADGAVLGTASPGRVIVENEASLDLELRRICFCGAAELSQKLPTALNNTTKGD